MTAHGITTCVYQDIDGVVIKTDAPWEICARLYQTGQEVILHGQRYRVLRCTVSEGKETVVVTFWPEAL